MLGGVGRILALSTDDGKIFAVADRVGAGIRRLVSDARHRSYMEGASPMNLVAAKSLNHGGVREELRIRST